MNTLSYAITQNDYVVRENCCEIVELLRDDPHKYPNATQGYFELSYAMLLARLARIKNNNLQLDQFEEDELRLLLNIFIDAKHILDAEGERNN